MVNTNDLKKKILAKRVQASLASRQDQINLKVRQVRSEYLIASAIEDEMENACECCALLTASVVEGDCVLSACYPNPKFESKQLDRKASLAARVEEAAPSNRTRKESLAGRVNKTLNLKNSGRVDFRGLIASGAINVASLEHLDAQLARAELRKK